MRAVLVMVLLAAPAWADAGTDAGDDLPDATAGMGGADQMTQEADENTPNGPCQFSRDCPAGFGCNGGRCVYVGFRYAQGCSSTAAALLLPLAAYVLARRLRRKK